MKQWKKVLLIVTVFMVALFCYNSAALAQNVLAGVDLWETRPGDATHVFGGDSDCPAIPADFFGPGSDPFTGTVNFQGQPLSTQLGCTDTIVERLNDAVLPLCPSSDTVQIEIVALNLVSTTPITVTKNGGENPELWDVQMCLSSAATQGTGTMTINKDCDVGGTFSAELPVTPKFIFTPAGGGFPYEWDYGWGPDTITYNVTDGQWLYSDHGFNVLTSPGGVSVDHDCNGSTADVTVGSSSNFYPGLQATPCNSCPGGTPTYSMVLTLWQSLDCGFHGVYPPHSDSDCDGIPDDEDNCPDTPNPGQEDSFPPQENNCGNACECEGDFNSDGMIPGAELGQFAVDFGRQDCTENPCKGDFNCDGMVTGAELGQFAIDFGRQDCPICPTDPWCVY